MDARALAAASAFVHSQVATRRATMEVNVSGLPAHWGFLVSAGLPQLVRLIERIAPTQAEVQLAELTGAISPAVAGLLLTSPCAVDVNAPPEGTLLFAGDTAVTIEGPLWQAWILAHVAREVLHASCCTATRAARLVLAARGAAVVDGSSCLLASSDHAVETARSAFVGGVLHTQSPVAAARLGVSLRASAPAEAIALAGPPPSHSARMSGWDFAHTVSDVLVPLGPGDDEEETLSDLQRSAVQSDGWVSRSLAARHTELRMRCDLVALEQGGVWVPRLGAVADISCVPGRKLVIRYADPTGRPIADIVHGVGERIQPAAQAFVIGYQQTGVGVPLQGAESALPLLTSVIRSGRRVGPDEGIQSVRERVHNALQQLADPYKRLRHPSVFPVGMAPALAQLKSDLLAQACGI